LNETVFATFLSIFAGRQRAAAFGRRCR